MFKPNSVYLKRTLIDCNLFNMPVGIDEETLFPDFGLDIELTFYGDASIFVLAAAEDQDQGDVTS